MGVRDIGARLPGNGTPCRDTGVYDDKARMAHVSSFLAQLSDLVAPQSRPETVFAAVEEYLAAKAGLHRPKTEANREYYLQRFTCALGEIPLAELTQEDTTLWINTLPPGSRHNVRTVVSPFLNWAAANGWPYAAGAKPRVARRGSAERDRYLTTEEFGRVASYLAVYAKQPRARKATIDALRLCLTTPLRSGEVVTLTKQEVSPLGDYVFLRDAKTGNRKVFLGPVAQAIVQERRSLVQKRGDYLFPGRSHSHIYQSSLSHRWRSIAKELDIEDVVLHDLRRTWASLALQGGERMETIRISLGHSTKHMTARYAHMGDERMADVAKRVERMLLRSVEHQLELPIPEHAGPSIASLTPAQRSLVTCPGSEVFPRGAGQAQAARALVRQGVLIELRKGAFGRTDIGLQLQEDGNRAR